MDVLSDILDTLRFNGSLYFTTILTAPWGIQVPHYENVARFHLAVGGECWVRVNGVADPVRLASGDMIIIPHGAGHDLMDRLDTTILSLDNVLEKSGFQGDGYLVYGGGDKEGETKLVCGHFEFDQKFRHPLLEELPPYILITGKQAMDFSWFDNAMKFMSYEAQKTSMGNDAMIKRLSEILFIHAVRVWGQTENIQKGFIKALADQKVGRSLRAFHAEPAERWTIENLAQEAGLSRTIFATQFRSLMDMTPMQYVTLWRMQKACDLLLQDNMTTEWVAEKVGYQSPAAFSKVFKKSIGVGPGSYRREHNAIVA